MNRGSYTPLEHFCTRLDMRVQEKKVSNVKPQMLMVSIICTDLGDNERVRVQFDYKKA